MNSTLPVVEISAEEAKEKYGITKKSIAAANKDSADYNYFNFVMEATAEPKQERAVCFIDEVYKKTEKDFSAIKDILSVDSTAKQIFDATDDAKEFFKSVPLLKEIKVNNPEAFYELKSGVRYKGIPSQIVYILRKAIDKYGTEYPNLTLWSCYKLLRLYATNSYYVNGELHNFKDIIDFVFKDNVKLISTRKWHTDTEYYVNSEDKVAIIPEYIAESIVGNVGYHEDLGLYFITKEGNIQLVRTLAGRIGLIRNDFDLRMIV